MSILEEDETDYPRFRETIPLRQAVRVVEQEMFDGWYDLYTAERRERETVEAYKSMPADLQYRDGAESLRHHWRQMETYLRSMEKEGRRALQAAIETGELPQYVFNLDAPGRRMFLLPPSRDLQFYSPHRVEGQEAQLWEVHFWQDEFDTWFQATRKRLQGDDTPDGADVATQKRYSAKRETTISCMLELFPETGGDPGENFILADVARKLKPLVDAKGPEWTSSEPNTYEARVKAALPFIRTRNMLSGKDRANLRQM